MRSWAGRLRRLLVPEQRGQMTVPAPRQCAHLLTNSSSHRVRAWLITMAKEATCAHGVGKVRQPQRPGWNPSCFHPL